MFVGNVYEKAHELEYFRDMKARFVCTFPGCERKQELLLS